MKQQFIYFIFALSLALAALSLQGCAPAIVAGSAAGAATVATDKRSAGTIIDDQAIEFRLASKLQNDDDIANNTNISITSYNHTVLITGEAPSQELKERVSQYANEDENIKQVHNEINVREPLPFKARNYDTWLTTKIKTKLLTTKDINSFEVKVVTSNTTVYLLGLLSRQEADMVARTIAEVKGVSRIVKAFEYTD